jgi:hypothetical protein
VKLQFEELNCHTSDINLFCATFSISTRCHHHACFACTSVALINIKLWRIYKYTAMQMDLLLVTYGCWMWTFHK